MKVLFCIRKDYLENMAGDSVQLLTTLNYLRKQGIEVYVNTGEVLDYHSFDFVHLFNLTRVSETYQYYRTAKTQGKKIVLTPIYWDLSNYYSFTGNEMYFSLWKRNSSIRAEILKNCEMVYPASILELKMLQDSIFCDFPSTIVYNCIGDEFFDCQMNTKKQGLLCVARICPRKNQLILAEVTRALGEELILVGETTNEAYFKKCLSYSHVTHKGYLWGKELLNSYKSTKLHVLCSFVETPGLSNLEAGALGCNLVTTKEGSTEEYFKEMALYCDPYNEEDIYNKIKEGLTFNKQPRLKEHLKKNFNIENCLKPLYESYFKILKQ